MARGVNKAILIGNAGRDAELKYLPSGASVSEFSLATSHSFKDKSGERKEVSHWHNIKAWGKLGEICGEYVKKGSQVYIEGRIEYRDYEAKDGSKRSVTEIVAEQIQLLGSKSQPGAPGRPSRSLDDDPITDDDVPF